MSERSPAPMRELHAVVPEGIDDPARASGGNRYDRRVLDELRRIGWAVREWPVPGCWPHHDPAAERALAQTVHGLPDGALVLVDGLIGSAAPAVLVPAAQRLRLVVLVHMAFGDRPPGHDAADAAQRESATLGAAAAVLTTSEWTRTRLIARYALPPDRVTVAEPGVDPAPLATGTETGERLLCVAVVAPHKGHDLAVAALTGLADLRWRLSCVGSLDRDPDFVRRLRTQAERAGIGGRVDLLGAQHGAELAGSYAAADALVLASRAESYGMVVTEALGHGLPVIATAVGGVPEALGHAPSGHRPGLLVAPDDAVGLRTALRSWLTDAALRAELRDAAAARRGELPEWVRTAERVATALQRAAS